MINVVSLNHPQTIPALPSGLRFVEKLSSAKPLPGAKKVGNRCSSKLESEICARHACVFVGPHRTDPQAVYSPSFQIQERAWSQQRRHRWFNGWGFACLKQGPGVTRSCVWWTAGRTQGQLSLLRGREMTSSRGVDVGRLISYWGSW